MPALQERTLSTTPQPSDQPAPGRPQRIAWAILIALTLYVCYFSHLDVIGFVGPDEPRYGWIARDMAESGDWITPRLYGRPWFEKPPLLYWGGAIFFKLLGEGHPEVAARLPSAICALLATLALAWLAWRTYGEECARWLLLLLPTSLGMIGFSHAAATDMPFAAMLTIALVAVAVVLGLVPPTQNTPILPRTPWLALLLFGFFLGLAVLAKGPAGILLIGGAVFSWALFTKRWRDALRLLHPTAIAAFCLTALPWYILCARRNPDFLRIFIIEHNFKRYLTPEFQHSQPFWFYLPILMIAFIPWSFLMAVGAAKGLSEISRTRRISPLLGLLLSWATLCLLFFSISKSKLPGYILPAVPAIGLLLSRALSVEGMLERRSKGIILISTTLAFLTAFVYFQYQLRDFWRFAPLHAGRLNYAQTVAALVSSLLLALVTALTGASFWLRRNSGAEFSLFAAGVLAFVFLLECSAILVGDAQHNLLSGKLLAITAENHNLPVDRLRVAGFRRDYCYALNFYLHREVPNWMESPIRDGFVLGNNVYCRDLKTADDCRDLWENSDQHARWSLLKLTPANSLGSPGSGRQPQ